MKKPSIYTLVLAGYLWQTIAAHAQAVSKDGQLQPSTHGVELQLPGVKINREKREITVEATTCLDKGLLEFAICKPGTFEHESLFTTEAKPEVIHAGLLLFGASPCPQTNINPDLWWLDAMKQEKSRVQIDVEWESDKKKIRRSINSLMQSRQSEESIQTRNPESKATPAEDAWIFCGSFIHEPQNGGQKTYAANLSGVIVSIWPDPTALIQYGMPNENPYASSGSGLEINEKNMPSLGTRVKLIFIHKQPSAAASKPSEQAK